LVDVAALMGDVFILVSNFHVPLGLKVGCPSSDVGCDVALVFIFLCVGLMAIFVVLRFSPVSFLLVCILLFLRRCVVSRLLVEFLRVQVSLCVC
jgi:hypothetical protein